MGHGVTGLSVSFRENHWRGLADHHTLATAHVVTNSVRPEELDHHRGRHWLASTTVQQKQCLCSATLVSLGVDERPNQASSMSRSTVKRQVYPHSKSGPVDLR